jgi:imidazolonepropionase-like amidohydrolase
MRVRRHIVVLSSLVCAAGPLVSDAQPIITAIENVNVVPMDSARVLRGYTVLLRDSVIEAVLPRGTGPVPPESRRIDGRGLYVMPGIADMHIHLRSERDFLSYLAHGVTTVFNLGGSYTEAPDLLRYRQELASGSRIGPTLYTSGPLLDGRPPIFAAVSEAAGSAEEARAVVRRQAAAGYDFIKLYNRLTPDAFAAAVRAARELGIAVGGHIPESVQIESALAAGIALIAHGSAYLDWETDSAGRHLDGATLLRRASLTASAGTTVIPNIAYAAAFAAALADTGAAFRHPEARYVDPSVLAAWRRTPPSMLLRWNTPPSSSYPALQQLTRALDSVGVRIVVGSDFPAMPGLFPGSSAIAEIRELERAGLSRFRALMAATLNAGDFVRQHIDSGVRFGRIAPGYRADFVLLEQNPLDSLGALDRIAAIIVRGRWLTREELQTLRAR